ncbi:MAG: hypothetical protein AB1468_00540, partial [Candidatus Micrarchaeota archaeon]
MADGISGERRRENKVAHEIMFVDIARAREFVEQRHKAVENIRAELEMRINALKSESGKEKELKQLFSKFESVCAADRELSKIERKLDGARAIKNNEELIALVGNSVLAADKLCEFVLGVVWREKVLNPYFIEPLPPMGSEEERRETLIRTMEYVGAAINAYGRVIQNMDEMRVPVTDEKGKPVFDESGARKTKKLFSDDAVAEFAKRERAASEMLVNAYKLLEKGNLEGARKPLELALELDEKANKYFEKQYAQALSDYEMDERRKRHGFARNALDYLLKDHPWITDIAVLGASALAMYGSWGVLSPYVVTVASAYFTGKGAGIVATDIAIHGKPTKESIGGVAMAVVPAAKLGGALGIAGRLSGGYLIASGAVNEVKIVVDAEKTGWTRSDVENLISNGVFIGIGFVFGSKKVRALEEPEAKMDVAVQKRLENEQSYLDVFKKLKEGVAQENPDVVLFPARGAQIFKKGVHLIASLDRESGRLPVFKEPPFSGDYFRKAGVSEAQKAQQLEAYMKSVVDALPRGVKPKIMLVDEAKSGSSIAGNYKFIDDFMRKTYGKNNYELEVIAVCEKPQIQFRQVGETRGEQMARLVKEGKIRFTNEELNSKIKSGKITPRELESNHDFLGKEYAFNENAVSDMLKDGEIFFKSEKFNQLILEGKIRPVIINRLFTSDRELFLYSLSEKADG